MHILDLLFPPRCVGCGKIGNYFCKSCVAHIERISQQICPVCARPALDGRTHIRCLTSYGLDGMYAAVYFRGPIKKAIHLLKYQHVYDIVPSIIEMFDISFFSSLPPFDFLTPVPLHPSREKERGFNQSLLLAQGLGERIHVPVIPTSLERVENTKSQADLSLEDRKKNTRNAFIVGSKKELTGKCLGLVDDVGTTRATLSECAKVLKRNGVKIVWAIVVAHG
ncbi:ComF family protein [Candidatus Gottesmanbacteria bacterium]|nr:ComF family protein [Candidatus Gottesmanbacteria bacterium]